MNPTVKSGTIIAAAIFAAASLWIYTSPYQSCVRAVIETGKQKPAAQVFCAMKD